MPFERCNGIAHAKRTFTAQQFVTERTVIPRHAAGAIDACRFRLQRTCHDLERAQPAFRGCFAKILVEGEQPV